MTGAETPDLRNYVLFFYFLVAAGFLIGKPAQRTVRSFFSSGDAFREFLTFVELPKRKLRSRRPERWVGPMPPSQYYEKGYDQRRRIAQLHPDNAGLHRLRKGKKYRH